MKYRDKIISFFESIPEGSVVSANELYQEQFSKMTESAFFKALERLQKEDFLVRVSKGMYAKNSDDQSQAIKEQAALNYYFGENNDNGMYIGYRLYTKYGISSFQSEEIEVFSNTIKKQTSNVGRVHAKRVEIELSYDNTRIIEALEILQNYEKIEELNKNKFARYARQIARGYQDEAAVYVISHMRYKKNTIAFLKKILDMYKVKNSLQQFLSAASRYKVPAVQRVAR